LLCFVIGHSYDIKAYSSAHDDMEHLHFKQWNWCINRLRYLREAIANYTIHIDNIVIEEHDFDEQQHQHLQDLEMGRQRLEQSERDVQSYLDIISRGDYSMSIG
jgi:hypothetical protein